MTKYSKAEIAEAKARLTADDGYALKPGDTIYSTVTHVSSSGMSRSIRFFVMRDNRPLDMTWAIARACGYSMDDKNGGLKTSGCGMDMCFHTVYNLGWKLFGPAGAFKPGDPDPGYSFRSEQL